MTTNTQTAPLTPEFARLVVDTIRADDKLHGRHTVRDAMAQRDAHRRLVAYQLTVGDMRSTFTADAIAEAFALMGESR